MLDYPASIRKLIASLRQLPGVGPRNAERLALHLLQPRSELALGLAESLREVKIRVQACPCCGFFTEEDRCEICRDNRRDSTQICVVEKAADVLSLEKSGSFRGLYHVLGGTLSPLDGIGPEQLNISPLLERCRSLVREVVLALGQDVKGETTSLYLAGELKSSGLRVSRLATGLSVGGSLDYADPQTLTHALQGRKEL
ncbi:MAG: recombination protein RecR [Blastochloris sp.]|nr:recombination protein RecR [Blastochloris sp.]